MIMSSGLKAHLARLTERIFAGDNAACFPERETILAEMDHRALGSVEAFEELLARVSTPIDDDDVFLGRVVEGRWPADLPGPRQLYRALNTNGHMTLDWATLLTKGLRGIAEEAWETAARLGTPDARQFAGDTARCVTAVEAYARRYADAARTRAAEVADDDTRARLLRAADALARVPAHPATDLHSALQAIWLIHLITSCYLGARDFAFGRLDQTLLPFYERDCAAGREDAESARALLAHFFLKTNEITGTGTWNYAQKPIPSVASKQYLMLGGCDAEGRDQTNALSHLMLEAAVLVRLPEPVLTVRLHPATSTAFLQAVSEALVVLQSQLHFYNDAIILPNLRRLGVPAEDAADYTMIGCCRLELGGRMDDGLMLAYHYHDAAHWLLAALDGGRHPVSKEPWVDGITPPEALTSFDQVLEQFRRVCTAELRKAVVSAADALADHGADTAFRFESLLLRDCVRRGKGYRQGGARYRPQGHLLGGIATVANSLMAIKRLVYDEQRFSLPEFLAIVAENFAGQETLCQEIRAQLPKFGNDLDEVDALAARAGAMMLDALDGLDVPADQLLLAGFYSLDAHHAWGRELPATPDGRLAGEPISENQSPTYGTDDQGLTALLASVARLPVARTVMGGLNVKFGGAIAPEQLAALLRAFFSLGGLHAGFTFIDRATLHAAQQHPEQYRTLCVRLYGYSEYFLALSPDEQRELIERTAYA